MLAILAAGKVWVPLNYRSTSPEIRRILDTTAPTALLVDDTGDALIQGEEGLKIAFEQFPKLIDTNRGLMPKRHAPSRDANQAIKFTGRPTRIPPGAHKPAKSRDGNQ